MRLFRRTAAALALALTLPAFCADLSIMPVAVQLDAQHDRSTVRVTNQGKEAVILQADAIGWAREAGVDRDTATSDLIVNPPVFTIAPGRTQIVRVGLRRNVEADREMTYRMVLREVPTPGDAASQKLNGQVRVLVALRVPVYVAPTAVRREQRWNARIDNDGNLVAQVSNTGNVHYKVGSLRVLGDTEPATVVAQGSQSVLFPGEVRSFRLRAPLQPAAQPLALEVRTEFGMQHVALDLPPR
jgi:fimbrial chaperone protein